MPSEFSRLTLTTSATPLDLAGARQVVLQAIGLEPVYLSNDRGFNDYLTIYPADGSSRQLLEAPSDDERLWVRAASSAATLEVWVVV